MLYRYRSPALAGQWRETRAQAVADAVAARQAVEDPDAPDGLKWRDDAHLEVQRKDGSISSEQGRAGIGRAKA